MSESVKRHKKAARNRSYYLLHQNWLQELARNRYRKARSQAPRAEWPMSLDRALSLTVLAGLAQVRWYQEDKSPLGKEEKHG